jgi:hypothetical protein
MAFPQCSRKTIMSLLSWFSTRKKHDAGLSVMPSSGMSRIESTKPYHAGVRPAHQAQPANRKQERMERRELLYAVVREAMVRAGVLSSSYKFKVLSLDPRGRTFLVMVDLAYGGGADTNRLAEIEAMVAQSAKSRYDILVSAVYWRANEHVAVGDVHRPPISRPAPLSEIPHPSELRMPPVAVAKSKADPLQAQEVKAFRQALDAGVRGEQALAAAGGPAAQSYTLLTGFEDTEMSEGTSADLSGTQWGQLR